jgi:hypothetical protein
MENRDSLIPVTELTLITANLLLTIKHSTMKNFTKVLIAIGFVAAVYLINYLAQ